MTASLSLRAAVAHSATALAAAGVFDSRLAAELLLCQALGVERAYLYTHPEHTLTDDERLRLRGLLERACRHEPIAYLARKREFFGLDFYVDRRVLIPRPETEMLVEEALAWARAFAEREGHPPAIADVGTGSGAIAVSLAVNLPRAAVCALDISTAALAVARRNARRHGVAERIAFCRGDLLAPLTKRVDLVCANLPYISDREMEELAPNVARFEPRLALSGGPDGLDVYRRLLAQVPGKMRPGGALLLEIGAEQGESAPALVERMLAGARVELLADLAGLPRLLRVELFGASVREED